MTLNAVKRAQQTVFRLIAALWLLIGCGGAAQIDEIIPFNSTWQWLHPVNGVDPAITQPDFHSTWMKPGSAPFPNSGNGLLGYGTIGSWPLGTNIGIPPSGKRYTAYFKRGFTLTRSVSHLCLQIIADDGSIIYIDGERVGAFNCSGGDSYSLLADADAADEPHPHPILITKQLAAGNHFIAISVHNVMTSSTDLGMNARLLDIVDPIASATWPVNGHRYEARFIPEGITWATCNTQAIALGGHLATITSAAENDFVFALLQGTPQFFRYFYSTAAVGPYFGGVQAEGAIEPDQGWGWVTGEPLTFINWRTGDPANDGGAKYSEFHFSGPPSGTWGDTPGTSGNQIAYIVEYDDLIGPLTLSNESPVCDQNPPPAPAVSLKWTAALNAAFYDLYRNGSLYKSDLTGTSFYNTLGLAEGQTYTYKVVAKSQGRTRESNTVSVIVPDGLCSTFGFPQITSIDPDPVIGSKSRQPVDVRGVNFQPGCSVRLTWPGETGYNVPGQQIVRHSSNRLTMNITTGELAGSWTAQVINPTGPPSGTMPFQIATAPRSLVPTNVAFTPASVPAGGTVTVSFSVRNGGTTATTGASAKVQLSTDPSISASDTTLTAVNVPALAAGAAIPSQAVVTVPTGLAGPYWLAVTVDPQTATARTAMAGTQLLVAAPIGTTPLRVSPSSREISASGGTVEFTVTNASNTAMPFTATVASGGSFVSQAEGQATTIPAAGSAVVRYFVSPNPAGTRQTTVSFAATSHPAQPKSVAVLQVAHSSLPQLAFDEIPNGIAGEPLGIQITAKNSDTGLTDSSINGDVQIEPWAYYGTWGPKTVSLKNGRFAGFLNLDKSAKDLWLEAKMAGAHTGQSNQFSLVDETLTTSTLTVFVRHANKSAAAGATVTASHLIRGQPREVKATTDALGIARLQVTPGRKTVTAVSAFHQPSNSVSVDVWASANQTTTLELPPSHSEAVLLVPGILGSNDAASHESYPSLPVTRGVPRSQLRIFERLTAIDWRELREALQEAGFTVFDAPWDWRMTVTRPDPLLHETAWERYLLPALDEAIATTGDRKPSVIAHSMGGLLIRGYLTSAKCRGDIEHVAFLGTPHLGAVPAYYIWEGGDFEGADSYGWVFTSYENSMENCYERARPGFRTWENTGRFDRREFVRKYIPSLEELMPTFECIYPADPECAYRHGRFYTPLCSQNQIFPEHYWIDESDQSPLVQFNRLPLHPDAPSPSNMADIASKSETTKALLGVDRSTVDPEGLYPRGAPIKTQFRNENGDGTVTTVSAKGWRFTGESMVGDFGNHLDLVDDDDVIERVLQFFGVEARFDRRPRAAQGISDSNLRVGIQGAARLLLITQTGKRVGVNPENDLPENTSFADCSVHEDNVFSTVNALDRTTGVATARFQAALGTPLTVGATVEYGSTANGYSQQWIGQGDVCVLKIGVSADGGLVWFADGPGKVDNLSAEPSAGGSTALKWGHLGERAVGYRIFARIHGNGLYSLLGTVSSPGFVAPQAWIAGGGDVSESWEYCIVAIGTDGFAGPASNRAWNVDERVAKIARPSTVQIAPASIQLNDASTGNPVSWEWDFDGDGAADSTDRSPIASFALPGTYTIGLKVNYSDGSTATAESVDMLVAPPTGALEVLFGSEIESPVTARWRISPAGLWHSASEWESEIPYESKQLEFLPIPGWTTPEPLSVTLRPETPIQSISVRYKRIAEQYHDWKSRVFAANASIPAIAGETADPEGDGLANFVEYVLGSDPQATSPAPLAARYFLQTDGPSVQFEFHRYLRVGEMWDVKVEGSDDLILWQPVAVDHQTESLGTAETSLVIATVAGPSNHRFFRLKVSSQ